MPRPSTKKLLSEVREKLDAKEYEEAVTLGKRVIEVDSTNYHAHVFIGVAAVAQKNCDLALQFYRKAIELRPEVPLAYKGVIQTLSKPFAKDDPLLLARSHFGLGSHSSDHSAESLRLAADGFFALASGDVKLRDEAISVLRAVRASSVVLPESSYDDMLVYRVCKLLTLDLPTNSQNYEKKLDADSRAAMLDAEPIATALDELSSVLVRNNDHAFYDGVAELVIERAVLNCCRNSRLDENVSFLQQVDAHEALLEVAELDHAMRIVGADVVQIIISSCDMDQQSSQSRLRCIASAHEYVQSRSVDEAIQIAGISNVTPSSKLGVKATAPLRSLTHAIVKAFFHLVNEEYKLCVETSRYALSKALKNDLHQHMKAFLSLLLAAGLRGDRKYKEAINTFESVRQISRDLRNDWLDAAANYGLVGTAIVANGRQSRRASTAIEEAAASARNTFGVLEYVWSDALAGDLEIERMVEIADQAVKVGKTPSENRDVSWVYQLLGLKFVLSNQEIAILALTRLGQMLIKRDGYTVEALTTAQKYHMEAAGLIKGQCHPFAHLGFIFEQLGNYREREKMNMRAIRCYERAVAIELAHPVASRRLARMLVAGGLLDEGAGVARRASDRDPKARWAFNLLGWWRLSLDKFSEAAVAFRTALRGQARISAKEADAIFGTDVGLSLVDNDVLLDVDSWRGLSFVYRAQGKVGPANACLQDALVLLKKPPRSYTSRLDIDLSDMQETCALLLNSEKCALSVLLRRHPDDTVRTARSILDDANAPLSLGYNLAEAYMQSAAEQWICGCYRKACLMRRDAGYMLKTWLARQCREYPQLNQATMLKRLGDIWLETVGECPDDLELLMSKEFITHGLDEALHAYAKACHIAPWDRNARLQDLCCIMLRRASFYHDQRMARSALNLTLGGRCDSALVAIAFMTFSSIGEPRLRNASKSIVEKVVKGGHGVSTKERRLLLDAAVPSNADLSDDIEFLADAAVRAARADPTDWRAWLSVAKVREVDAQSRDWPEDLTRTCEQAYAEADRLGGGPVSVSGRLRCVLARVNSSRSVVNVDRTLYADACFALALSSRAGVPETPRCGEIARNFNAAREEQAIAACGQFAGGDVDGLLRHVHMFCFCPAVAQNLNVLRRSNKY